MQFLQKSTKDLDNKSQHRFFYGAPQGCGVLMFYYGGVYFNQ